MTDQFSWEGTCVCGHDYRQSHHPSLEHNADQRAIHKGCGECDCSAFQKKERPHPTEWKVGHVVSDTAGFFHKAMISNIRHLERHPGSTEKGMLVLYDINYQDDEGFDRRCTVTADRLIAHRNGLPVRSGR